MLGTVHPQVPHSPSPKRTPGRSMSKPQPLWWTSPSKCSNNGALYIESAEHNNESIMWSFHLEPLWSLENLWNLWIIEISPLCLNCIWNLEPWWNLNEKGCGAFCTLGNNLYVEPCETWDLLRVECGTVNPVPGFPPLPQTTPKFCWKNPKLFKLLRKN